jgi:hypothetical protein
MYAGNSLSSLAQEEEIDNNLSFLSDFDKASFCTHMEFNPTKDLRRLNTGNKHLITAGGKVKETRSLQSI